MQIQIAIQQPVPTNINQSYIPFGFYKLGVLCWQYEGGWDGEIEWINTLRMVTQPKLPNPIGLRYWFQPGVTAILTPVITITASPPDITLDGVAYNAATGKNMPLIVPGVVP